MRSRGFIPGSEGRPVGVFFCWASLWQDKPEASRTPEQSKLFMQAFASISACYAHRLTTTWMLTHLPQQLPRPEAIANAFRSFRTR